MGGGVTGGTSTRRDTPSGGRFTGGAPSGVTLSTGGKRPVSSTRTSLTRRTNQSTAAREATWRGHVQVH